MHIGIRYPTSSHLFSEPGKSRRSLTLSNWKLSERYPTGIRYNSAASQARVHQSSTASLRETMAQADQKQTHEAARLAPFQKLLPVLGEAWFFCTVAVFIVIRILGSNAFGHLRIAFAQEYADYIAAFLEDKAGCGLNGASKKFFRHSGTVWFLWPACRFSV